MPLLQSSVSGAGSSPSPRSRVYFTWRKTARNLAALLAFAVCAFLGILGELAVVCYYNPRFCPFLDP